MADEKCLCEHCKSRYSWDCDDGMAYPRGGCESFSLDWSTLSNKQQNAVKRALSNNSYDKPQKYSYWDD